MSRPRLLSLLLVPALGLTLAACAITPPGSPVTTAASSPSPTLSSVTPTPTPPATSVTPTPTPTPAARLILRGDGLGDSRFGAKQVDVADALTTLLGDPDESSQGILCELDDSSPWAQTVNYGGLWVLYTAKDQSKKSARNLAAWGFSLQEKFAAPLEMQDAVPLTLTFKQLKAAYPKGKLESLNLSEGDGSRMFTLPNKIRFIGSTKPDMVSAGRLTVCE